MPKLEIAQKSTTLDRTVAIPAHECKSGVCSTAGSGSTTNHPSTTPIFGVTTE
jgi:hypothetical protein